MTTPARRAVQGLGEIALRVENLEAMAKFYEDVIGLELMRRESNMVFFKIAEGYAGHTQILALFDREQQIPGLKLESKSTTLDHIAFTIAFEDYDSECARLESHGLKVVKQVFDWVQWRSLFVRDPEDNHVELVCYDRSITRT